MIARILRILEDKPGDVKAAVLGLYALLAVVNAAVWFLAFRAFHPFPALMGTAVIAYAFGLRHAVDADHVAAIDNVTRKLMQEGKRPVAVGFFFSLGHSTVVMLASVAVALAAAGVERRFPAFQAIGGVVGTAMSAGFLFLIAFVNAAILRDVYQAFKTVKEGDLGGQRELDALLEQRGLLGRFFRRAYGLIGRSWHMYPLGFLFGLGFDTATEVALLGITAVEAAKGLVVWSILLFPALFTAGMCLVDTTDGVLMLAAYGWAFVKPIRKLYYNLTITSVSVLVAFLVGGIETLGLLGEALQKKGWFWGWVARLNGDFGTLGYLIIGVFVLSWLVSTAVYKWQGYEDAAGPALRGARPSDRSLT